MKNIDIECCDGIKYLENIKSKSIDLILTDPPYIISHESGMNIHYNNVKNNKEKGGKNIKTEEEWNNFKNQNNEQTYNEKQHDNFLKYGSIYGKKYCVKTNYGDWDNDFTMNNLDIFIQKFYEKLRDGGTLIIWFDLWKITELKKIMEKNKFKQIRMIEWIKTNPQPLNQHTNYLTNCREIALLGVKKGKPTFNSKYDNGIYFHPLQSGKNRFHPTQKSLTLFQEIIEKHSNVGDTILDTFLGAGTTAIACNNTNRHFKGCEINNEYVDRIKNILNN